MVANTRKLKTLGPAKTGKSGTLPKLVKTDKVVKNEPATGLDRLIHERTRLALVSALAANTLLTFNDLKSLLAISDGNLSAHAQAGRCRLYRLQQGL
jgi:hypothetical protein